VEIVKIFFSNYYGDIENIFNPNNLVFTTPCLKLVNEHQSFPIAYKILESALRKSFSENVCYL